MFSQRPNITRIDGYGKKVGRHRGQTRIEKTVRGGSLYQRHGASEISNPEECGDFVLGDEHGVDSNPRLLSLRLFAALCIFALKIQSGERTRRRPIRHSCQIRMTRVPRNRLLSIVTATFRAECMPVVTSSSSFAGCVGGRHRLMRVVLVLCPSRPSHATMTSASEEDG
jgi:hypothetical protein